MSQESKQSDPPKFLIMTPNEFIKNKKVIESETFEKDLYEITKLINTCLKKGLLGGSFIYIIQSSDIEKVIAKVIELLQEAGWGVYKCGYSSEHVIHYNLFQKTC